MVKMYTKDENMGGPGGEAPRKKKNSDPQIKKALPERWVWWGGVNKNVKIKISTYPIATKFEMVVLQC